MKKLLLLFNLCLIISVSWSQQLIDQDKTSNFIKADNSSTYYIYEDINGDFGIKSINTPSGAVNTLSSGFVATQLDKLIQLSSNKLLLEKRQGGQYNIVIYDLGTDTFAPSNIILNSNGNFVKFDNKIFFTNAIGELAYTTDGINQTAITSAVTPLNLKVRNIGGTDYLIYRTNSPVSKHIFTLQAGSSTPVQRTALNYSSGIPEIYPIENTSKIAYSAYGDSEGSEVWILDIANNTETRVTNIYTAPGGNSFPNTFKAVGDNLYFSATSNGTSFQENLYSYNLQTTNVTKIETPNVTYNAPRDLIKVGDYLFFRSRIDDNAFVTDRKLVKVDDNVTEIIDFNRINPEGLYSVDTDLYYTIPTNQGNYAIKSYNVESENTTVRSNIILTQKTLAVYTFDDVLYVREEPTNTVNALYRFDAHCSVPSNIIESRSATALIFDWEGVNPYSSQGYDYALVLQGNDPNTQAIQPGSTPSTLTIKAYGISSLTEGVMYEFCVRSKCSTTLLSEWNKLTFTVPALCETVTNVTTSNLSSTSITLNWDTSSYASSQTWYIVPEGQGNINTFIETGSVVVVAGPQQSVTINATNLTANTNYDVYIVTTCQSLVSNSTSDLSDIHTFSIPIACDAPTNVSTSNINASTLDISWSGSSTAINGYRWYVVPQGQGITSAIESNVTTNTTVTVNTTNLSASINYDVYVSSICSISPDVSELSSVHTFTMPAACDAPDTISIIDLNASGTSFFLSWTVSSDAINGYAWYILPSGSTDLISAIETGTTANSSSTFVTVSTTSLTPGSTYNAYVVSLCSTSPYLDSGLAGIQTFTMPLACAPPSNITTSNLTTTTFNISWTLNAAASNGYNWYVVNSGAEGIGSPLESGTVNSSTASVTVSNANLVLNSSYDVYVESICTVGQISDLGGVHTFTYQTLSIADLNLTRIKLYPNPIINTFKIENQTYINSIDIINIQGQLIKTFKPSATYDISSLKSGLYFAVIKTLNNRKRIIKILKE